MKKYLLLFGFCLCTSILAQAQVNVNFVTPFWGPKVTTEEYYFLPDIDSYYDIQHAQFICIDKGVWLRSKALPSRYRNYKLNTGNVVIINDYHGSSPYLHYKNHKVKYFGHNNRGRSNAKAQGNRGNGKAKQNKK